MLDGFRILMSSTTEKVAFIEGHNEASELEVFDFTTALARYFRVDRGAISGKAGELRITSYNVCYTKLLRAFPIQKPLYIVSR